METSFPLLPEVTIKDEILSSSEILRALVQQLQMELVHPVFTSLPFEDVDEYLARTIVTKLEITDVGEGYEPMTNLDACKLNLSETKEQPFRQMEEKIDLTGWFDSTTRNNMEGEMAGEGLELKQVRTNNGCNYGLSLNERIAGCSSSKPIENDASEFPSWSLGPEFETNVKSPATPGPTYLFRNPSQNVSSYKEIMEQQRDAHPSTPKQYLSVNKGTSYGYNMNVEPCATAIKKNELPSHVNDYSPMNDIEDYQKTTRRYSSFRSQMVCPETTHAVSKSVKFIRNTLGLSYIEREYMAESLKHVEIQNKYTTSDVFFVDGYLNSTTSSPGNLNDNTLATYTTIPSSAQHSNVLNIAKHGYFQPSSSQMNSNNQSVFSTVLEDELFNLLTINIKNIVYSSRIFQIEERWADERTLALCMSDGGYINDYVMNAYIKMILNDQKMKDKCGERIACLKYITSIEMAEYLMDPKLDCTYNKNCSQN